MGYGKPEGKYDRFRSFAERYLVARAALFDVGKEQEQGWQTILDAKTLYKSIERISHDAEPVELPESAPGAQIAGCASNAVPQAPHMTPVRHRNGGVTTQGPYGPGAGHTGGFQTNKQQKAAAAHALRLLSGGTMPPSSLMQRLRKAVSP